MDDRTEFVQESAERITQLNNDLLAVERDPDDEEAMRRLFRTAHTLKGNAGGAGFDAASDLAHALEDLLEAVRSGQVDVTPELMDAAFDAVDELETMVDEAAATGEILTDPGPTIDAVREVVERETRSGATTVTEPTTDEIDAVLAGLEPPTAPDFETYLVRLAVTESDSGPVTNGVRVLDALIDAFDVLGTDPGRDTLEDGTYGGRFDAVFASAVGEEAIAAALEPIEVVADFAIRRVSDRFDALEAADASSGEGISTEEASELSVDDLLDEFDEFDDLDEKVKEVEGDEDLEVFDEMGEAGAFDDLFEEADVEPEPAVTADPVDASGASASSDGAVSAGADDPGTSTGTDTRGSAASSAGTEGEDDQVDDAEAVFAELKEEVDPVGFDELQAELEELEFDEFEEEEIGMDELLAETDDIGDAGSEDAGDDVADAADAADGTAVADAATTAVDPDPGHDHDHDHDPGHEDDEFDVDDALEAVDVDSTDDAVVDGDDGDDSTVADQWVTSDTPGSASDGEAEFEPGKDSDVGATDPGDEFAVDDLGDDVQVSPETEFEPDEGHDEDPDIVEAFDDAAFDVSTADDDGAATRDAAEAAEGDVDAVDAVDAGGDTTADVDVEPDASADVDAPELDPESEDSTWQPDATTDLESESLDATDVEAPDQWATEDGDDWTDPGADDWDAGSTDDWADTGADDWADSSADEWTTAPDDWSDREAGFESDEGDDADAFDAREAVDSGLEGDADVGADADADAGLDAEAENYQNTDPSATDLESTPDAVESDSALGIDDQTDSEPTTDMGAEFGFDEPDVDDGDSFDVADSLGIGSGTDVGSGIEFGSSTDSGSESDARSDRATAESSGTIVEEPDLEIPDITVPSDSSRESGDDGDEIQSIRVDVEQIDELLSLVEGLVTTRGRLRHAVETDLDRAALEREVEGLDSLVTDLQGTVMDVRLVPLETVTSRLPRIVRDVAREQDKEVALELSGMDVELDRAILERLRDPLVHLVRNAVDHGIESPATREDADKPAEGQVEVTATRSRDRVAITVADDGRGLDPDALREEAVEADVVEREAVDELADDEALELAFHPGLSTATEVTDVSGRGVGMDVVKRTVEELDGTIAIDSAPGEGTTVRLTLPVSIAIDDVLFLECGGEEFGVPTSVVQDVEPIEATEVVDGERVLPVDGEAYPVVSIEEAFGLGSETETAAASAPGAATDGGDSSRLEAGDGTGRGDALGASTRRERAAQNMLIRVRDDVRPIAIECDRVREQQEVVVKPYVGFMGDVPGLSGATVRGRGTVVNILDVTTL